MTRRNSRAALGTSHQTLIANLKRLRAQRGLTQAKLAGGLFVEPGTVSGWETGAKKPDFDMLDEIAQFYGVSVSSLFTDQTTADTNALLPPADTPMSFFNYLNALVRSEIVVELDIGEGRIFGNNYSDNRNTGLVSIYVDRSAFFGYGGKIAKLYDNLHALSKLLFLYKDEPCPRETFETVARSLHEALSTEPPFSQSEESASDEDGD